MSKPPRSSAPPGDMVAFHRGLNRGTAESWQDFADHRRRVSELLMEDAAPTSSLAVLGAGNCNDLLLDAIVPRFAEVHLFDLDREALVRARDRQPAQISQRLVLHAPVDRGGALSEVGQLRKRGATPADLGRLPQAGARGVLAAVTQRFDRVASTCLLSQLVHGCEKLLGDDHPQLQEIACAIVVAHLRILVGLVAPGGAGLLITDMVSSDTYPLNDLWHSKPPWELVRELEDRGNHLSGTTPRFTRRILNTDPVVAPLVESTTLVDPWLWQLGPEETYLVYALRFQRRNDASLGG